VKLYYSPTSPYVRKVMACAITRGIDTRIERIPTNPHVSPPDLVADNPLSKVPCLVTDDGLALFDSPVICEYLDSVGDAMPLFPEHGAPRWRALKLQAMADGILDAAVGRRGEMGKPQEAARDTWMARQKGIVARTIAQLEADPPHKHVDIGSIAVACALGYLDFRYADEPWREGHPRLTAWYGAFAQDKALSATAPA
jgi:glutathione S-transferase